LRVNAGFSLLEVLVSMFIASIALIGLGVTQLKSLQFANNSFDYTVSLVQAQNAIERMWPNLCNLQHKNPALFSDPDFLNTLKPPQALQFRYELDTENLPSQFKTEMKITVSWKDERVSEELQNNILNQITLNANYVEVPSGCSPKV
tara:strand:- start:190 stop:630 length:441 start_codon:yes stop_codon:yes gene_type:complete